MQTNPLIDESLREVARTAVAKLYGELKTTHERQAGTGVANTGAEMNVTVTRVEATREGRKCFYRANIAIQNMTGAGDPVRLISTAPRHGLSSKTPWITVAEDGNVPLEISTILELLPQEVPA